MFRKRKVWEPATALDCDELINAYEASLIREQEPAAAAATAVDARKLVVACLMVY